MTWTAGCNRIGNSVVRHRLLGELPSRGRQPSNSSYIWRPRSAPAPRCGAAREEARWLGGCRGTEDVASDQAIDHGRRWRRPSSWPAAQCRSMPRTWRKSRRHLTTSSLVRIFPAYPRAALRGWSGGWRVLEWLEEGREYLRVTRRIFEILVASFALISPTPVILSTALLVRVFLGSLVLFSRTRPGRSGPPFAMMKLRSMRPTFDARDEPATDCRRLTSLGRFLRASNLDESPELWNVPRGDMSLVGLRSPLMVYLPLHNVETRLLGRIVSPWIPGMSTTNRSR